MEYTEQIERYIEGRMGKEELESFRKKLSGNPQLAALVADAVRIQQAGNRIFAGDPHDLTPEVEEEAGRDVSSYRQAGDDPQRAEDIRQFREKLLQAEKEQYKQDRLPGRTFLAGGFWYYVAALVILAVAIPLLINRYGGRLSCPDIYRQYYLAYAGTGSLFEQTRSDNAFLHAVKVYEDGQYQDAVILLEPFIASEEYGPYALFYSGLACMGMENFTEAILYLQRSLETTVEDLAAPAHWYLGLSYLAVNDAGASIKQFETAGRHPGYSENAAKIIRKIRKVPGFSDQ